MAKLIYATNVTLDGYIEDARGAFDWFPPDADVFRSTTDLLRSAGTFLYGRRLYETMAVWETNAGLAAQSDLMANFASAWQTAKKVVYSTTLAASSTGNTRIERHFDPTAVREMKVAANSDITVGGANLAAQAFKAGLVDECHCSSGPSSSAGESRPYRPARASTSNYSTSTGSETVSYASDTAPRGSERPVRSSGVGPARPSAGDSTGRDWPRHPRCVHQSRVPFCERELTTRPSGLAVWILVDR